MAAPARGGWRDLAETGRGDDRDEQQRHAQDPPENTAAAAFGPFSPPCELACREQRSCSSGDFPSRPDKWQPAACEAVNERLPTAGRSTPDLFLNLNRRFLDGEGRLSAEIMSDALHPSEHGYQFWAGDGGNGHTPHERMTKTALTVVKKGGSDAPGPDVPRFL